MNDDNDENRRMVEQCYRTRKTLVNPIVDWSDEDVWEFLNDVAKVPHCTLYDEGFKRIGCIGCPMGRRNGMERDFARWPKYKTLYLNAFKKMIENRNADGWDVLTDATNTPPTSEYSLGGSDSTSNVRPIRVTPDGRMLFTAEELFHEWLCMMTPPKEAYKYDE